jgi:hypothetical protein
VRSLIFIGSYCALAFLVAFAVQRFLRGVVWMALLSATTSAIVLQIVGYLYLGYVDAWADIAFVTSWLIALGCAVVTYLLALMRKRIRNAREP